MGLLIRGLWGRWQWGSKKPVRTNRNQRAGGARTKLGNQMDQGSQEKDDQYPKVLKVDIWQGSGMGLGEASIHKSSVQKEQLLDQVYGKGASLEQVHLEGPAWRL